MKSISFYKKQLIYAWSVLALVKLLKKIKAHIRLIVQVGFTAITNSYINGYVEGNIFKGPSKAVCVPGLNCYSCPGALGSCPIGSLQAVLGSRNYKFAFYVLGFLMIVGALCGRLVCGWLCPFGLIQDLLYKIPFIKKLKKLPGDKVLKWLKYVILVVFVLLLPMFAVDIIGQGKPWFCEYICPSGTLSAGVPLVLLNENIRSIIGWLYAWKLLILGIIILLSILVYRPFCRYLCPLGGIYGLFNPISLYRYKVDAAKCTKCGKCQKVCNMDIKVYETPNSIECIRCGACKKACPHKAIQNNSVYKKCSGCEKDDR
ncbi:MAG TPA: 4Fe-4S binding protein [Clostridiales bacterium]|nr:4Fe-4S binding protein [Clostridiales bacterium]